MPRSAAVHFNIPNDDEHTACGRKLAKVKWDVQPARVTCLNCKKAISNGG